MDILKENTVSKPRETVPTNLLTVRGHAMMGKENEIEVNVR
jgi:hypothetical protein